MQHEQTEPNPAFNLPTDRRAMLAGIGGLAAGAILVGKANAGPLNPPAGPIESTGKTLRDVEPRIAINSTNTPGDTDSVFRISSGGSYYLTGNVFASTGKSAIEIAASNVTIDLSGYSITTISNLAAIRLSLSGRTNISVRNGHIGPAGTGGGIDLTPLIGTQTVGGSIENVHVTGTEGTGIQVGDGVLLVGCTSSKNSLVGIKTGDGCAITTCSASDNGASGISAGKGCSVTECSSSKNDGNGITTFEGGTVTHCSAFGNGINGIGTLEGSQVSHCSAYDNGSNGIEVEFSFVAICSAYDNGTNGINVFDGSTVTDCNLHRNSVDGIRCRSRCVIRANTCDANGLSGDGAGIHSTSFDNRIEDNHCTNATRGIDVDAAFSIIIRNTCGSNATNWSIVSNNVCLVVQATTAGAISGNAGGVSPGSTNPNANFTY